MCRERREQVREDLERWRNALESSHGKTEHRWKHEVQRRCRIESIWINGRGQEDKRQTSSKLITDSKMTVFASFGLLLWLIGINNVLISNAFVMFHPH